MTHHSISRSVLEEFVKRHLLVFLLTPGPISLSIGPYEPRTLQTTKAIILCTKTVRYQDYKIFQMFPSVQLRYWRQMIKSDSEALQDN